MAAPRKKTINLLPKFGIEQVPLGKLLQWALTLGRYVFIFTELVVILVFLSRFRLDRELNELHEEIEKKKVIVANSAQLEKDFRFLQKRLAIIEQIQGETLSTSQVISALTEITPLDVTLSELQMAKDSISLSGTSLSNTGLATFLNGFRESNQFDELDLKSVATGGEKDPSLDFQIWASLKKS